MSIDPRLVSVTRVNPTYPDRAPFSPSTRFPECFADDVSAEPNDVYAGVREVFRVAGLDVARFGSPDWNPLGEILRPGQTILLKPNMIKEYHPRFPDGWRFILTHGSIVRAVADYIWIAIGPHGRLIIADAPQTDSSFSSMVKLLGFDKIVAHYAALNRTVELIDLRREQWVSEGEVVVSRTHLDGDPRGNVAFDLADRSEFVGHAGGGHYYGADYDAGVVNQHHSNGSHEYLIGASVMACDAIVSLPKLKTHKKAGITVSLKNVIGVNADKNWLPHHTEGSPSVGGDERPKLGLVGRAERRVVRMLRAATLRFPRIGARFFQVARRWGTPIAGSTESHVRSGNWYGNDTLWRTCLDLNKILLYGENDGRLREAGMHNQCPHLVVVDGVIAGEGSGPMDPDPVLSGLVLFGTHPASADAACAALMGFDPDRIPIVREAFHCDRMPITNWPWQDVKLVSTEERLNGLSLLDAPIWGEAPFRPHFGWVGHIEAMGEVTAFPA